MTNLTNTSAWLAQQVAKINKGELFEIVSADPKKGLPLVAWKIKQKDVGYDEYAIASHMRQRGWILPAYSMPPKVHEVGCFPFHFLARELTRACHFLHQVKLLRVVVREDFSKSRAEVFMQDLREAVRTL